LAEVEKDGALLVQETRSVLWRRNCNKKRHIQEFPHQIQGQAWQPFKAGFEVTGVLKNGVPSPGSPKKSKMASLFTLGQGHWSLIPENIQHTLSFKHPSDSFFDDYDELYYNAMAATWLSQLNSNCHNKAPEGSGDNSKARLIQVMPDHPGGM